MSNNKIISRVYSLHADEINRPQARSIPSRYNRIVGSKLLEDRNDGRVRVELLLESRGPANAPNVKCNCVFLIAPQGEKKGLPWKKLDLEDEVIIDGKKMDIYTNA